MSMSQFENVSVIKQANIYFDGKCVSHTLQLADGSRKTIGVILPSALTFTTHAAEVMECVGGSCRVRFSGDEHWKAYGAGQSFSVPANSSFEIVCDDAYHYVCHYG